MAQVQRKIVHKQFNSPIALYSDRNVKETLNRELKTLNNGAVGIDFDDPTTTRTGNLAKSAVLQALEDEERERSGQKPGLKRVAWPPPPDSTYAVPVEQNQNQHQQQQPPQQPISFQQPPQNPQVAQGNFHSPAPQQNYSPVVPKQPTKAPQQQRPVSIHGFSSLQSQAPSQPLSPLPLLQTTSPQIQNPSYGSPRGWAHVAYSPRSPGAAHQQPKSFYNNAPIASPPFELSNSTSSYGQSQNQQQQNFVAAEAVYGQQPQSAYAPQQQAPNQYAYNQQAYAQPQQTYGNQYPQQNYGAPAQQVYNAPSQPAYAAPQPSQQLPYQGNPLRKEAPITQKPSPVYQSQPVASTFQGGANRRGDSKWPPTDYKQSEMDNQERRRIALGPIFRPKRVNKVDYSEFFAANALSGTYPGYRVPPGTTHVNE